MRNRHLVVAASVRTLVAGGLGPVPGYEVGRALWGKAIGEVTGSADPALPVGATVVHPFGWRTHAVGPAGRFRRVDPDDAFALLSSGLVAFVGPRGAGVRPGDTVQVSGHLPRLAGRDELPPVFADRGGCAAPMRVAEERLTLLRERIDALVRLHDGMAQWLGRRAYDVPPETMT
ncbi:hypothetical protein Val02_37570 [Virgisporangium aliadipatigenens]|uniref:Oxidoreductase N-terminal domain-containing protein n=1 Tax=Virgisporangium aliadipatigenens TaxID=741659 RepID=A0A8J4DRA7_9ACTN|nr:hypothetical protein Val02_37570 [Virgisporangium aliadipatigenens]